MRLAIIILNWNGLDLLQKFLPSVVEHSSGHSIYLADNASTDNSIAWVSQHYPHLQVIAIPENMGYAGGYNYVIPQIKEELLCLLNSDVEASPGWCAPVISAFEKNPHLAAAQPKILDYSNKDRFEYAGAAGGFLDQLGYPYCRGRVFDHLEMDHGQYDYSIETDWASGAALFVRKDRFQEVGGFDQDYFAHQEEIDLCWRLRHLGYVIQVIPESQVYHLGGGTLSNLNPKKTFLNFRNSLFTVIKNDHRASWWILMLVRMILDGVAAIKFLVGLKPKHSLAILKAHAGFYRQFSVFLGKRKKIKENILQSSENQGVNSVVFAYYVLRVRRLHPE